MSRSAETASLFRDPTPPAEASPATPPRPTPASWITAHCDGGARGNPGPAGYGAVLTSASGDVLAELSEFLGVRTNNFAEYAGLLACLQWALDHGHTQLRVVSDSELMVKQIQGKFKVKSPDLLPLWQEARRRIARIEASHPQARFEIAHALRHKNKDADRLANQAMDRGMGRGTGRRPDATAPSSDVDAPKPALGLPKGPDVRTRVEAPQRLKATAPPQPPAMLRGFTRDGAIHLLGGTSLPDGVFVKIIPE